jgi:ribulose-5-phosphate 4-epimerase/fuculose-1-phosphate aldolase
VFTRTALFYACTVTSAVLLGGTIVLGLIGGISSDATAQVAGLRSVGATQVSAGYRYTCALLSNHTVKCWGFNGRGQLGNGKKTSSLTPVPVKGIRNATQVSTGAFHACAVLSNHRVKCWGYNYSGQLGNGKILGGRYRHSSIPVPVGGIKNAIQVSAGHEHTCALLSNHTVKCWGKNTDGALGNGTTTDSSTPVPVSGVTNATQVSAGHEHSCALLSDGTVECWGGNNRGQLGDGGTGANSSTPVQVSGITSATQVSARSVPTCALLSDHGIECWGVMVQLDDGTMIISSTPFLVSGITTAVAISQTCALLSNHTVECWGFRGQLDGTTIVSSTPVLVNGITTATQVSAGGGHTCAVLSNHGVKCWGRNWDGQLGNGTAKYSSTPVSVVGLH